MLPDRGQSGAQGKIFLRARAKARDDRAGCLIAELRTRYKVMLLAQTCEETRGKRVTSTRRIHNLDRRRRNIVTLALADDDSTLFTPRDHSELGFCGNLPESVLKIRRFVQRQKLGFVGKENIDVTGDKTTESRVMTTDTERV